MGKRLSKRDSEKGLIVEESREGSQKERKYKSQRYIPVTKVVYKYGKPKPRVDRYENNDNYNGFF